MSNYSHPYYYKYLYLAFRALDLCDVQFPRVLKCDCFNEAKCPDHLKIGYVIKPHCSEVVMVEINEELVKNTPGAVYGDVRDLSEYRDFDILMDFSTLDHIIEYQSVIEGYAKVLKKGGIFVLVSWVDEEGLFDALQCYFPKQELYLALLHDFFVLESGFIEISWEHHGDLVFYICRRK